MDLSFFVCRRRFDIHFLQSMGSKYQTRYDGTFGPNTFRADDRLDICKSKNLCLFPPTTTTTTTSTDILITKNPKQQKKPTTLKCIQLGHPAFILFVFVCLKTKTELHRMRTTLKHVLVAGSTSQARPNSKWSYATKLLHHHAWPTTQQQQQPQLCPLSTPATTQRHLFWGLLLRPLIIITTTFGGKIQKPNPTNHESDVNAESHKSIRSSSGDPDYS